MAGNKNSGNPHPNPNRIGIVCHAHTSRGLPCRAFAMANGCCAVHGGKAKKGIASPAFRHGRHSKYLGTILGGMVTDALSDPDRMGMESELALLDARIGLLLQRLEPGVGGTPADWIALQAAMHDFQAAQARKSVPAMHDAMVRIQAIVESGAGETAAWRELADFIERRRALVESEERRSVAAGKAVPTDVVMALVAGMSRIMLDEVADPASRARISERITSLVHGRRLPLASLPKGILSRTEAE